MSLPINREALSEDQIEALKKASPPAGDILQHMDLFNEEIEDIQGAKTLPEDILPTPVRSKPARMSREPKAEKMTRAQVKIAEAAKRQKERGETMDFDSELDAIGEQLMEKSSEPARAPEQQSMRDQILQLLRDAPDAPSEAQIQAWKKQYGKNAIHVMGLGEGDVYVFTHLKRAQWKKIEELMAKVQQSGSKNVEDELREKVVQHCVIWPKLGVEFFYNSRAGIVDDLYQVILLNSYFLTQQQAMLLTTQL